MQDSQPIVPRPKPILNTYYQRFKTIEQRFLDYVDKTSSPFGCWLWSARISLKGYGDLRVAGTTVRAHRLSWELYKGPIPFGLQVHHDCPGGDNPTCVNPDHLWLGTQQQNCKDMHDKGRAKASQNARYRRTPSNISAHATITPEQALEIRARYAAGGVSQQALANEFDISQVSVSNIVIKKTWFKILS